jgi:hypothetical protein
MQNHALRSAASSTKGATVRTPGSLISPGTPVMMANAPSFYASGAQLASVGNDVIVSFTRPVMGHVLDDGVATAVAEIKSVVEINMSIKTIKDLSIILSESVGQYETQFGEIQTDFTRSRTTEK